MKKAAKLGSSHSCPAHVPGTLKPAPDGKLVETNGVLQGRAGDQATCFIVSAVGATAGPADFVVTGAATVQVNSKPAARLTSHMMHGGTIDLRCASNVLIGGPSAGTSLGGADAAERACQAAAAGRHPPAGAVGPNGNQIPPGRRQQSYNNCGVESSRIIVNQKTGKNISEDDMLDESIDEGDAAGSKEPAERVGSGSSTPADRTDILERHGVESTREFQTMDNIEQAVAEKKGVITSHDAGELWDDDDFDGDRHAVNVTGLNYNANGELVSVTILDTGTGQCRNDVPADRFRRSMLNPPRSAAVTKESVW